MITTSPRSLQLRPLPGPDWAATEPYASERGRTCPMLIQDEAGRVWRYQGGLIEGEPRYEETTMITTLHGDCRDVLLTLPEQSVQCVVTSPPYFGLRSYLTEGDPNKANEIGLEPIPDCLAWARQEPPCGACYVCTLRTVFAGLWRVLRADGVAWLNLGDIYTGSGKGGNPEGSPFAGFVGSKARERAAQPGTNNRAKTYGIKEKNLLLIPSRVALALQSDGWIVRSDIVWAKGNPMPESVTDRPTRAHEQIYLLAKQARYYYDAAAVAEPAVNGDPSAPRGSRGALNRQGEPNSGRRDKQRESPLSRYVGFNERYIQRPQLRRALEIAAEHNLTQAHLDAIRAAGLSDAGQAAATQTGTGKNTEKVMQLATEAKDALGGYYREFLSRETRNLRDVWHINPQPYGGAHFAVFPEAIPERCIKASTRPGDTVLDPFGGSGTTARVATRLQRDCILIELNADYLDLQDERTNGVQIEMVGL